MSTKIKNTTTGEITELACIIEGQDILADVMGGAGVPQVPANEGGDWAFGLEDGDVEWWSRWAEREERIVSAYEDASEDERKAYERAISEWGHDYERLQDLQEVALGLAGYTIYVYAADNASADTYLTDHYATYDEARARLDEIVEDGGWGANKEAAIFEVVDSDGTEASLDTVSL